jgi:hypothetical protein
MRDGKTHVNGGWEMAWIALEARGALNCELKIENWKLESSVAYLRQFAVFNSQLSILNPARLSAVLVLI